MRRRERRDLPAVQDVQQHVAVCQLYGVCTDVYGIPGLFRDPYDRGDRHCDADAAFLLFHRRRAAVYPADYHPVQKVAPKPDEEGPISFKATYQIFKPRELAYWQRYGITQDILKKYEVKSVRSCRFFPKNKESYCYTGSFMEPMYGYTFNDCTGIKVYRPFSKTRFLYGGNLPKPYVFGWNQLPDDGDAVIITGGEKDVMTLAAHGFTALAFNSESARITDSQMTALAERFHHIVFMFDCDTTGKRESAARIAEFSGRFNVSQLILPLSGTKREKDISDYFKMGHTPVDLMLLIEKSLTNLNK